MTHTYEIKFNGVNWEGEVSWDSGSQVSVSTNDPVPSAKIQEWEAIVNLFKQLGVLCAQCGEIDRIEIVKKI